MADQSQVLVISGKETFIVKAIQKNIRDVGIPAYFAEANVSEIDEYAEETTVIILYMDESVKDAVKVFVYLNDLIEEKKSLLLLIGSEDDYHALTKTIPKEKLTGWFRRPFDMHTLVEEVRLITDQQMMEGRKKSILVVDDDPTFLRMVFSWLKMKYHVSIVNSGMQAITWLANNRPDLILLDYEMPVNSGVHVLEMLKGETETRNIPVMFLTGKSDLESIKKALPLRPEKYLLKAIGKEALMAELEDYFKDKDD